MPSVYFDSALSDEERRRRLYAGDIVILSATPGTRALVSLARKMLENAFAPHDPRTIHNHMTPEQVVAVLSDLKPSFIHHPECKKLIPTIMSEHGVALDKLYFDVPRLRSAYPSHFLSSGIAYAFHPHRDTWYSAPMCQLNWWIPVYPLDADNAMGFYPGYFDEPVKNNSETYNYYAWNTKSRASAAQHVKTDTREQPKPQQKLEGPALRYLPAPGGVIVFSGAQLHETVPNTTHLARYSIDFRTVHLDDVVARGGAANLDSRCTGTTMRDYLRASDLEHLPEEIVQVYDDGTATTDQVLYFGDRLRTGAGQSFEHQR
ncbi:MAG TPA: hypothetical protein VLD59_03220 [Steroidobacteraceae bacterium]|nr:hypothetical protein [Steroidobacteraceae bacterium]